MNCWAAVPGEQQMKAWILRKWDWWIYRRAFHSFLRLWQAHKELRLDVYVMSPAELHNALQEARECGGLEARMGMRINDLEYSL